eukprot:scaffold703_cov245-Pinguiococcus_pyrenoidosus.AAC.18
MPSISAYAKRMSAADAVGWTHIVDVGSWPRTRREMESESKSNNSHDMGRVKGEPIVAKA